MEHVNRKKQSSISLSRVEILLINLPVVGFLCLACCALGGGLLWPAGRLRFFLLIVTWWSLCGGFMLLLDYKNKRCKYLRLLRMNRLNPCLKKNLLETICGFSMYLSYLYRKSKNKKQPAAHSQRNHFITSHN